jgi:DUF2946 family protein
VKTLSLRRIRRRTAAWLALASMVLNASWPLLANAKPATPASPSEICSASGSAHSNGGESDTPDKGLHCPHCALCLFHADRLLPARGAVQPPLPSSPAIARVPALDDAPRPAVALHPAAPPRAPPVPS